MRSLFALIHPRRGLQMWGLEKDTTSRGPVGIGLEGDSNVQGCSQVFDYAGFYLLCSWVNRVL